MQITVTLTQTELDALGYASISPQEWADNFIKSRAQLAIAEIVTLAVDKFLAAGESIPGSQGEIVQAAFTRGWVQAAKDRHAAYVSSLPNPA